MPPEKQTEQQAPQEKKPSAFARMIRSTLFWAIVTGVVLIVIGGGILYIKLEGSRIYTDTASITAPLINLAPATAGTLQAIYVQDGDVVKADTAVAEVNNQLIKTTVDSIVVSENNNIGALFTPGQTVVSVIDPSQLRVDAQVEEDKGLSRIQVGDQVAFTVDAFGSKKFNGVVDEVSPISHQSDIVFNISDEREEQDFDIKIRFNPEQYPDLKDGMSAKVWIYQ